jgi:hypothetical protein
MIDFFFVGRYDGNCYGSKSDDYGSYACSSASMASTQETLQDPGTCYYKVEPSK